MFLLLVYNFRMSTRYHSLFVATVFVWPILAIIDVVVDIAVRASVDETGVCMIKRNQNLSHRHAERDEKVDKHAVTARLYGRRVHGANWCWCRGTA